MIFKNGPLLPGAWRTSTWHHHGCHTPTSPVTILIGKMAYHTKQIRRQCIWTIGSMWQTKYASSITENLGVGLNFRPCSEGYFLSGCLQSVFISIYYVLPLTSVPYILGSWNHPVVCRAIFSRKRNPQLPPTSLGPAALHPRHLKRSTEWRPTLNSEMNNPKTLHHEENHSRHQVIIIK